MNIAGCTGVSGFILSVLYQALLTEPSARRNLQTENKDVVPWPEDDPSRGLITEQSCCRAEPSPSTSWTKTPSQLLQSQHGPPGEMQGTFNGEGGEYNSKGVPKVSVSICQDRAGEHIHYPFQGTQSMSATQQWQKKAKHSQDEGSSSTGRGPGETSPTTEWVKV